MPTRPIFIWHRPPCTRLIQNQHEGLVPHHYFLVKVPTNPLKNQIKRERRKRANSKNSNVEDEEGARGTLASLSRSDCFMMPNTSSEMLRQNMRKKYSHFVKSGDREASIHPDRVNDVLKDPKKEQMEINVAETHLRTVEVQNPQRMALTPFISAWDRVIGQLLVQKKAKEALEATLHFDASHDTSQNKNVPDTDLAKLCAKQNISDKKVISSEAAKGESPTSGSSPDQNHAIWRHSHFPYPPPLLHMTPPLTDIQPRDQRKEEHKEPKRIKIKKVKIEKQHLPSYRHITDKVLHEIAELIQAPPDAFRFVTQNKRKKPKISKEISTDAALILNTNQVSLILSEGEIPSHNLEKKNMSVFNKDIVLQPPRYIEIPQNTRASL